MYHSDHLVKQIQSGNTELFTAVVAKPVTFKMATPSTNSRAVIGHLKPIGAVYSAHTSAWNKPLAATRSKVVLMSSSNDQGVKIAS
jgi:hypothetical protein